MKLNINYEVYLFYNLIAGISFSLLYLMSKGFVQYYNLAYGILVLGISIWGLGRYFINTTEDQKIRVSVQTAWLLVSFGLGYISIIYAPVLSTSVEILAIESILSLLQFLWGSVLLAISYKRGYSIIRV
ncbi:MAG: hypothetical protein QXR72_14105 [Saccharolobus sp.]|uniref:hypothetical protein n=1 Tax=Saccharolobus sp. TaxID=2100761 RepID=UPI003164E7CC